MCEVSAGGVAGVGYTYTHDSRASFDDFAGLRRVRGQVTPDIAAGEYGYHLPYFARTREAQAVDCLQIDVTRCGGYGEWLQTAAPAAGYNIDISGHCAPNLTARVALATPNLQHVVKAY